MLNFQGTSPASLGSRVRVHLRSQSQRSCWRTVGEARSRAHGAPSPKLQTSDSPLAHFRLKFAGSCSHWPAPQAAAAERQSELHTTTPSRPGLSGAKRGILVCLDFLRETISPSVSASTLELVPCQIPCHASRPIAIFSSNPSTPECNAGFPPPSKPKPHRAPHVVLSRRGCQGRETERTSFVWLALAGLVRARPCSLSVFTCQTACPP